VVAVALEDADVGLDALSGSADFISLYFNNYLFYGDTYRFFSIKQKHLF